MKNKKADVDKPKRKNGKIPKRSREHGHPLTEAQYCKLCISFLTQWTQTGTGCFLSPRLIVLTTIADRQRDNTMMQMLNA